MDEAPHPDRLDSWKEIAAYLKRDVSTVQRWEKREAMPVHRHLHDKLGSVYALRSELDAWSRSRRPQQSDQPVVEPADARLLRRVLWASAAAGAAVLVAAIVLAQLARSDYFWRSPITEARFQLLTDFDGTQQAAAISRDGKLVAFLSNRDGQPDVWVTQVGTGRFYNLTKGSVPELVNPSVRTLTFSPDGAFTLFWARKVEGSNNADIGIWAVPTLSGEPRPYLDGVAELDWSADGSRLVYHTPGPGDPTFVADANEPSAGRRIFAAPAGLHAHYPLWSPDQSFIYFVQGSVPNAMDIWRMRPSGGSAERITFHNSRVSHPVLLNEHTLLYLATDADGSGPWLYGVDVRRRAPHRLSAGVDRYASLTASADGRRLVATLDNPKATLWRVPIADTPVDASAATPIALTTGPAFSPRLGPDYLLYTSSNGEGESIWKTADGTAVELWRGEGAHILGGPAIASGGDRIAFAVEQQGRTRLYVMNSNGTDARVLTDSLDVRGAPTWAPDGQSLTVTLAAGTDAVPRIFRLSADGRSRVPLVSEYSTEPAWASDGRMLVYSGPDIGTRFTVKAVTADGGAYPLPKLTLTRGARHLRFLPGRRAIVALEGDIEHKDFWLIDLETGAERQLTKFGPDFIVRDFDVSPNGLEIVLQRVQERSEIVLLDLPGR
jgi:Tol biopolymer transport system component